jgi:GNAT superfamily N-acetyltransferase
MSIQISLNDSLQTGEVIALYAANHWSSAKKPEQLMAGLRGSHSVVTARDGERLVGLGNAISDGHLVVYYPHLLVHPSYQHRGIGSSIMRALINRYQGFHQHMITADGAAIQFYEKLGFQRAGKTLSMWIYEGADH